MTSLVFGATAHPPAAVRMVRNFVVIEEHEATRVPGMLAFMKTVSGFSRRLRMSIQALEQDSE